MRRLVDRSWTGRWGTGRQNHRCWSTGEDCGNGGKLYRTIFAFTVAMSLSRNLGRAMCIGAIAFAGQDSGQIKTEIAEDARPLDVGVTEVAVYQMQKLVGRRKGIGAMEDWDRISELRIA